MTHVTMEPASVYGPALFLCLEEQMVMSMGERMYFQNLTASFSTTLLIVVQLFSCVQLLATPWTAACQASLSFTISLSLPWLMSIESVMPSNHLILCHPLLLLPSVFPSIRVFSNESALHITHCFDINLKSDILNHSSTFSREYSS